MFRIRAVPPARFAMVIGACWLLLGLLVQPLRAQGTCDAKILVTKTANVSCAEVGDEVVYTIRIKNIGTTPLTSVCVKDSLLGDLTPLFFPCSRTLAPGESVCEEVCYTVCDYDVNWRTWTVDNEVRVTGNRRVNGLTRCFYNEASYCLYVDACEPLEVDKTVSSRIAQAGDCLVYTITITNTTNKVIDQITVWDNKLGNKTWDFFPGSTPRCLQPYESRSLDFWCEVETGESSPFDCTTYVWCVPGGTSMVATDECCTSVRIVCPEICVRKYADRSSVRDGETITYTVIVKNEGDVDLRDICVYDTLLGDITCKVFPRENCLREGEEACAKLYYTVRSSDPDPLVNVVYVSADPVGLSGCVTDYDRTIVNHEVNGETADIMIYNTAYKNPAGANIYNTSADCQTQYLSVYSCTPLVFPVRVENDANCTQNILIKGTSGNASWKVRYYNAMNGGRDITALVTGCGWNPSIYGPAMGPDAARDFIVVITPTSNVYCGESFKVCITALSDGTSDTCAAVVTAR